MKDINLSLSNAQYKTLIELVYMGDWMANAIREPNKEIKKYKLVEQVVYKVGTENGFSNLLEFDEKYQQYFPTRVLEESKVSQMIEEYDEQQFWEELADMLAMRDFQRQYNAQEIEAMEPHELIERNHPFLEKYWNEIDLHGAERLEIVDEPKSPAN